MSIPTKCKALILQNKPVDAVNLSGGPNATFAPRTLDIPSTIPDDSILVKTLLISNDPAQRGRIQKGADPKRLYVPPLQEGEVMGSRSIAKVIKVGGATDTYKEGDFVLSVSGWSEYAVVQKATSRVVTQLPGLSLSAFLGPLGPSGLTAYWGLVDVLRLQPGETLVVSGAAGAVGNVVVQLAKKVIGAKKVIAIAGSKDKADYIRKLGADIALDYKSPNFEQEFIDATPEFPETFFDNVGGEILDLVLKRLKQHGRIAACGAISRYNDPKKASLTNYMEIIANRLELKGFITSDYGHRQSEGLQALMNAYKSGKLIVEGGETIVEAKALEDVPQIWHRLFEGRNQGKLVTKLPE